ncbi:heterotetrameric sarcosine oxidase delta subunit [Azorhizobium sp. AG788]|uniref:sarcosine oxidase subunit delta n=1 Tax=Azorhizobium sp. AG788 TaxID=2183897 RepID=UPI00105CC3F1|nr:sarcosine oxidase subunit delta [Azorhizobium sp. AG788]TDT92619.1 heterotetrameric sarcosine oxidase delta subunit [Azorhizobium sp. AG788]
MLLVTCPYCGARPEIEFHCGGEAHIARPETPAALDDADWASYLYTRTNPKGVHAERWRHVHGCGRWFNALRNTVSDRFIATYKMGEPRPDLSPSQPTPAGGQ